MVKKNSDNLLFPRAGVGAIVIENSKILLVKRKNPPSQGLWAIPGGHIQAGETMQQAVEREILEETGLIVKAGDPYFTFDIIEKDSAAQLQFHYLIVDLLAEYISGEIVAGDDALDAAWFPVEKVQDLPISSTTLHLINRLIDDNCFP